MTCVNGEGEIAMRLQLLAAETASEALPTLIAALEGAKAVAWGRLLAPPATTPRAEESSAVHVTARDLAAVYKVPPSFFYELARHHRLPCIRLGRYVRFNRVAVERALTEARNSKTASLGAGKKRRTNDGLKEAATALLPSEHVPTGRE